jgi:hypothetical protein
MCLNLIVHASPGERQRLLSSIPADTRERLAVRSDPRPTPPDLHDSRIREWLDHQALALAVEARTLSARGAGLSATTRDGLLLGALAIHGPHATSLDRLECELSRADCWASFFASRLSHPASEIVPDGRLAHRRRVASSTDGIDLGRHPALFLGADRTWSPVVDRQITALCPGSFFPLHAGHRGMRDAAESLFGGAVVYEMTVRNADKPPLDHLSVEARVSQFEPGELVLSAVPRFDQKSELFPNCAFVVGFDTALRVLDRRFYARGGLESALDRIARNNGRFAVAPRRIGSNVHSRDDLEIPSPYEKLFVQLPGFEQHVSSTEVRAAYWRGESDQGPVPIL